MEVKTGYKQTEVGVIPEDWDTKPFSALSDLITVGIVIKPTQYYVKQGIPALRSANIREARIDSSDMVFISEKSNAQLAKSQLRAGDVVTVRTGYPGTSTVVTPAYDGSNCIDLLITRPSKAVSSEYLAFWINSPVGKYQVLRNQGGLAQQHFNVSELRNLVVALPPLHEQKAIAEVLSKADALIECLERLIAKKHLLKRGVMQKLLRPKNGWEIKRLGGICEIAIGRTPSRLNSSFWGRGYKWLSIADLRNKVVTESKEEITELAASKMQIIPKGTLLMSFKLSIGRLCFAGCDLFTNEAICSFNDLQANAEFLYYMLGRTDFSLYGKQAVKGYTLNKESLKLVEVPLPSQAEQEAIAKVLSAMDAEIALLEAQLAKYRQIKQGLMQNLLTGRIRLV
jgi:type I restriction enzyme S subunit